MEGVAYNGVINGGMGLAGLASMGPSSPMIFTSVDEFHKAVTAGAQISPVGLEGGGALRLQSIEPDLLRTIQQDKHFVLFNKLAMSNATATVDEFSIKKRIGGYPGSGFNSETGTIAETQGTYERQVGIVKFLMTRRSVSVVQDSQRTMVNTIAEEKIDAVRELKTTAEWTFFNGDSSVVGLEWDGIRKQVLAQNDPDIVRDVRGEGLSMVAQEILDIATAIYQQGRYGTITDALFSPQVQNRELNQKLDPQVRVLLDEKKNSLKLGSIVRGIECQTGTITPTPDVFLEEGQMPWDSRPGFDDLITAADLLAPVIASVSVASSVTSQFLAAHGGSYYYGVASTGKSGRSSCVVSAVAVIGAGDKATVNITNPADPDVTGFWIHRSRRNGTNALSDLREMIRIPRQAGATTVFVDENADIPGTSTGYLLNLTPGDNAITFRRLLPMTMFPLFPTDAAVKPWAQLMFGYLRIAKPRQHGIIKNILPTGSIWRPF